MLVDDRLHGQKILGSCCQHVAEGAGTDGLTEEVDEDLPQTVEGNEMVDVQVNGQSLHARASTNHLRGTPMSSNTLSDFPSPHPAMPLSRCFVSAQLYISAGPAMIPAQRLTGTIDRQ
ncbi:MAG: hypothetical protein R6U70_02245 [Bacillota bacterium]